MFRVSSQRLITCARVPFGGIQVVKIDCKVAKTLHHAAPFTTTPPFDLLRVSYNPTGHHATPTPSLGFCLSITFPSFAVVLSQEPPPPVKRKSNGRFRTTDLV